MYRFLTYHRIIAIMRVIRAYFMASQWERMPFKTQKEKWGELGDNIKRACVKSFSQVQLI
jgi:hypothetical protein